MLMQMPGHHAVVQFVHMAEVEVEVVGFSPSSSFSNLEAIGNAAVRLHGWGR